MKKILAGAVLLTAGLYTAPQPVYAGTCEMKYMTDLNACGGNEDCAAAADLAYSQCLQNRFAHKDPPTP